MNEQNYSKLEKSILATICYFDVFDYPLTLMEIWKWLLTENQKKEQINLFSIQKSLDQSQYLKHKIESKGGFYFLKGRDNIIITRKERYIVAEQKFQKALKVIRFLRLVPFVKMVAVCNTLAFSNSREQADIDLFIVTERKRIWQVRFWVTGFLKIFGLRPSPPMTKNTFCPSFFVDEDSLDLEKLAIKDDVYLFYWVVQVFPVYDEGIYKKFIQENQWIREKLVNSISVYPSFRRKLDGANFIKKILRFLVSWIPESLFKNYQMKILPSQLRNLANQDSRVVIQDYMLKFHDNDRRELFTTLFRQKLEKVINE